MTTDARDQGQEPAPKAKVFISYSRKDMAFADRLETALKARGFEPLIDRTEIYAFEEWWKRIEALIASADTVVYVVSPDGVGSKIALREVSFAASLHKRLAPIVCRRVDDEAVPEQLAKLNFIFFDDEARFDESADKLVEALTTDIGWIRQHTEFGEHARRWALADRPNGLLLRSPVLEQAERWIASRPPGAPMPTDETQEFIRQSRQGATRRRNILSGSLAAGLVLALSLAGIAYWQRLVAVEQRDAALVAQSRFLVGEAEQQTAADDPVTAQLLAIEGLPDTTIGNHRPLVPELEGVLVTANFARRELAVLAGHKQLVRDVAFSPDGKRVLTASWDVAQVWDVNTGQLVATLKGHDLVAKPDDFIDEMTGRPVAELRANRTRVFNNIEISGSGTRQLREGYDPTAVTAVFSPNGKLIATSTPENRVIIWREGTASKIASLEGHKRLVRALTFSPDSSRIATASDDGTARVWDSATGVLQATLVGHSDWLTSIAFSPKGDRIATGSEDGSVRIWSARGGPALMVLRGPRGTTGPDTPVLQVAFSHDGLRVVAACADNTARVWMLANGTALTLAGHTALVTKVRFNVDSTKVVTSSWDQTVRVWDALTGALIHTLSGHAGPVEVVEFNMDGSRILTASRDKTARIWNTDTGGSVALLRAHPNQVWAAHFSSDGKRIVTGSDDGTARLWDATEHAQVRQLGGLRYGAFVSFSPDGTRLVTTDARKTRRRDYVQYPRLWSVPDGALIAELKGKKNDVARAVFSPDGSRFAFASQSNLVLADAKTGAVIADRDAEGGAVYLVSFSRDGRRLLKVSNTFTGLFDGLTGALIRVLSEHSDWTTDGGFDAQGQWIITASRDRTARVWDGITGAPLAVLTGHTEGLLGASFATDGKTITTLGEDGTVWLWSWDGRAATQRKSLHMNGEAVNAQLSPDGRRLWTASVGSPVQLWEAATGNMIATLEGHVGGQPFAAFNPEGDRIITWTARLQRGPGEDPTARLWDGETGALVAVLRGHTDWVSDAQFSVDGKQIITISNDGTARVWDGVTGTPLLVLKGHSFWVQDAVYSPDRRWLATGGVEDESQTTEALLWPTFPTTQEAVDFAKLKVPRCLTPEQRLRFFLPPQVPSWCVEKRKWPYRTP